MPYVLFEKDDHRCIAFNDLVRGDDGVQANQFLIQRGRNSALIDPAAPCSTPRCRWRSLATFRCRS